MEYKLAKGKIETKGNLNLLLITDMDSQTTRDITHNINYEIEKILREKYYGKNVLLGLTVKTVREY